MEGKKHLLNRWRRDPSKLLQEHHRSLSPNKRGFSDAKRFKIDINETGAQVDTHQAQIPSKNVPRIDTSNALLPKPRAAGGIWLAQSDFSHAFQNIIIYHNIKKYTFNETIQDIWENPAEPFIGNEREIYIKLELDDGAVEKTKQEELANRNIGVASSKRDELEPDSKDGHIDSGARDRPLLLGEREKTKPSQDNIIIACAPYPTNKPHEVLPRYLTKIKQVDYDFKNGEESAPAIVQNYTSYFEGHKFKIINEMST